jgi:hypothetical protein
MIKYCYPTLWIFESQDMDAILQILQPVALYWDFALKIYNNR